jgi:hypothetical protein
MDARPCRAKSPAGVAHRPGGRGSVRDRDREQPILKREIQMHPYVLLLSHLYLSDLRHDADAHRLAVLRMASGRETARRADPGRLARLRRTLGSLSGSKRSGSLDLPAAA